MIGFVIWSLFGVFIIGLGIKDMFSKNPVGFWANTETIKVKGAAFPASGAEGSRRCLMPC